MAQRGGPIAVGPGLMRLSLLGAAGINCYLATGSDGALTLVDTGLMHSPARIEAGVRALGAELRDIRRIVLTHAHRDHVGAAPELVRRTGATVFAHVLDRPYLLAGTRPPIDPRLAVARLANHRPLGFEALTAVEAVSDGDRLDGDLTVVHLPGHTRGQIGLHHAGASAVLVSDALFHVRSRLGYGPRLFCEDIALGRESVRRLAQLDFAVAGFGHGPELRSRAQVVAFVTRR